ncbi:MAG: helix-turn-helix transcriptional regulator, partial [Oscillospiraceae bacterium]
MKLKYFQNETFKKTYYSYLIPLTLIFIIFLVSYSCFIWEGIQKKNKEIACAISANISKQLDEDITSILALQGDFYRTSWINKYMSASFESEFSAYDRMKYCRELKLLTDTAKPVSSAALIFPATDTAVTGMAWASISDCTSSIQYNYGIDITPVIRDITQSPLQNANLIQSSYYDYPDYLVLLQNLEITNKPRGYNLFLISKAVLENPVKAYLGSASDGRLQEMTMTATLESGMAKTVLSMLIDQPDKKELRSVVSNSAIAGWSYHFKYRDIITNEDLRRIWVLLSATPLLLILGAILVYWISIFSFGPLDRIFRKMLGSYDDTPQSLEAIEKVFDGIMEENCKMKETTEHYRIAIKNNFLVRLVRGYFATQQERHNFGDTIKEYGLPFNGDERFRVCVLCLPENSVKGFSMEQITRFMKEASGISDMLQLTGISVEMSVCEICVILAYPLTTVDTDTVEFEKNLLDCAGSILGFWPELSVGPLCDGLIGISKSYHKAIAQRESSTAFSNDVDLEQRTQVYYPADWEMQLISNFGRGNVEVEERILQEIISENAQLNSSSDGEMMLASLLHSTIAKVMHENSIDIGLYQDELNLLLSPTAGISRWESIRTIGNSISPIIAMKNAEQVETGPDQKLVAYVEQHYTDSNLSLKEIAQQLNTSVSAVSRTFKKATGVNFLEYITDLRMQKAKGLLLTHEYSIHAVG